MLYKVQVFTNDSGGHMPTFLCVFRRLQYYFGLKIPRIAVFSGYMAISCNAVRSTWCY